MADEDVRVPAGWYPDPLGLPQLRWWDNHSWTEHTSDARQPVMQQDSAPKLAYADDFPEETVTRVSIQQDVAAAMAGGDDALAFDEPLLSLEAPVRDEISVEEPPPAARLMEFGVMDEAPTSLPYDLDTRYDDLLGAPPQTPSYPAPTAPEPVYGPAPTAEQPYAFAPQRGAHAAFAPFATDLPTNTGPVWIIALMPILQLVAGLLYVLSGAVGTIQTSIVLAVAFGVPYIATIVLAILDRRRLLQLGYERPAHWAMAFLTAPVYLIARFAGVVRQSGSGFAPLMTWFGVGVLIVASIIAVPGLVIALAPAEFAAQAAQSVEGDALILGTPIEVTCPSTPPILISTSFDCQASSEKRGTWDIAVSLQRSLGWIEWRVEDWGVYSTSN